MTVSHRTILTGHQHRSSAVEVYSFPAPGSTFHETEWQVDQQSILLAVLVASSRAMIREPSGTIHDGELASGSVFVCRPGTACVARFAGAFELVAITIKLSALLTPLQTWRDGAGASPAVTLLPRDALVEQLVRSMVSTDEDCDDAYACAIGNLIMCRAARSPGFATRAGQLPKWRLKRVQSLVESRIEHSLTLADLAAAADLSRMHFAAQFRATTGVRPHEYILLKRVERSKTLMLQTDEPLAQIALASGFQAQSHFSTTFKRITGQTPATWRRQSRTLDRHGSDRSAPLRQVESRA